MRRPRRLGRAGSGDQNEAPGFGFDASNGLSPGVAAEELPGTKGFCLIAGAAGAARGSHPHTNHNESTPLAISEYDGTNHGRPDPGIAFAGKVLFTERSLI